MKKTLELIISIILVTGFIYVLYFFMEQAGITAAIIYSETYRNVEIKFYEKDNKEECFRILDLVPDEYLEGLEYIKILPETTGSFGHYHENFVLEIYGECTFEKIMHELAHHRQKMMNDSPADITHHMGRFNRFEGELFSAMQGSQKQIAASLIPKTGLAFENMENNTTVTQENIPQIASPPKTGMASDIASQIDQPTKREYNFLAIGIGAIMVILYSILLIRWMERKKEK
jgi:hypothetical protein